MGGGHCYLLPRLFHPQFCLGFGKLRPKLPVLSSFWNYKMSERLPEVNRLYFQQAVLAIMLAKSTVLCWNMLLFILCPKFCWHNLPWPNFVSQLSAARNKKKLMFVHVLPDYLSLISLKFFYRGVTMAVSSSGTFIWMLLTWSIQFDKSPASAVELVALWVWIFICPCLGYHVHSLKVPQL